MSNTPAEEINLGFTTDVLRQEKEHAESRAIEAEKFARYQLTRVEAERRRADDARDRADMEQKRADLTYNRAEVERKRADALNVKLVALEKQHARAMGESGFANNEVGRLRYNLDVVCETNKDLLQKEVKYIADLDEASKRYSVLDQKRASAEAVGQHWLFERDAARRERDAARAELETTKPTMAALETSLAASVAKEAQLQHNLGITRESLLALDARRENLLDALMKEQQRADSAEEALAKANEALAKAQQRTFVGRMGDSAVRGIGALVASVGNAGSVALSSVGNAGSVALSSVLGKRPADDVAVSADVRDLVSPRKRGCSSFAARGGDGAAAVDNGAAAVDAVDDLAVDAVDDLD